MADFATRFADFKGGDWGVRDSSRADADTWHGENLVVYRSGLLGPRAGLKALPVTGLPVAPIVPGPMGFAAWGTNILIVLNRVYSVPQAGGAATAWATYPASATTPVRFVAGNGIMYSLLAGVLYKHNGAVSTTVITTPAPLSQITRWGYYFVGVDANRPWRIWWNQVDASGTNFDSWPANNFLDVGNNDAITALMPIYNTLYCGKKEGWWAVSGVLGTLASVRDTVIGNGPSDIRVASVTTDNRVLYWPVQSVPAWFNGERVYLDEDQEMKPRGLPFTGDSVIVTPTSRRLVMAGDDGTRTRLFTWSDSAWTHHSTAFRLGALAPADVRAGSQMPEDVIYAAQRPITIGEASVIASFHHDLGRPGHASDQYAAPGDLGADLVPGFFELPAWYDGQGRQVQVRSVIVQFRKWASGVDSSVNRLQCRIDAVGRYGGGDSQGVVHEWIEPSARASTDGTDESWRINAGEQGFGNGFRIYFPLVQGVAIREVVVVVNVRTERT